MFRVVVSHPVLEQVTLAHRLGIYTPESVKASVREPLFIMYLPQKALNY